MTIWPLYKDDTLKASRLKFSVKHFVETDQFLGNMTFLTETESVKSEAPSDDKYISYLGKYQALAWQTYNFLPKEEIEMPQKRD